MAAGDEYFTDLVKIEILYTGERNTAANVLWATCPGAHGASLDSLETIATALGEYYIANMMPLISSSVSFEACTVADWTSADGLTAEYDNPTAGSLTGGKLPSQVCVLVNYLTNTRYRGGHGRTYVPQPDTTKLQTDQTWTSAFQTAVEDFWVAFLDQIGEQLIGEAALTPVLYHRAGSKDLEQGTEDIIGLGVSLTPGTQRRRVRRVGHLA